VAAALLLFAVLLLLSGCDLFAPTYTIVRAPEDMRVRAYRIAEKYVGMEYEWGGQDHYSTKGIDCSGLIVNCYREALEGTGYELPYLDAAAGDFRRRYSSAVDQPARGDLVFMGEPGEESVSHIAILDRIEEGTVYFIDASTRGDLEGVERRSYSLDNDKIKGFGRALLLRER